MTDSSCVAEAMARVAREVSRGMPFSSLELLAIVRRLRDDGLEQRAWLVTTGWITACACELNVEPLVFADWLLANFHIGMKNEPGLALPGYHEDCVLVGGREVGVEDITLQIKRRGDE